MEKFITYVNTYVSYLIDYNFVFNKIHKICEFVYIFIFMALLLYFFILVPCCIIGLIHLNLSGQDGSTGILNFWEQALTFRFCGRNN